MCKKILIFILVFLSLLVSCERKPLYLQGDTALMLNVQVEADINAYWNATWRDSLKYNWDESEYGPLFYSLPEACNVVIFNKGNLISETSIKTNTRELIDVELNNTYDLLIYSKEYHWIDTYYKGGIYYIETPSSEGRETKNEISHEYETVSQPGEIFAMNKKQIYLSNDISDFEEVFENGKLIYVYNIDELLEPVSYIYIIQFIIINDDNSDIIEARDIANFTISGISTKKNMFTNTPIYTCSNKQISTFDIKRGQKHGPDSLIFASRVTILDLLPNDENSSWYSKINYLYYTNIDVNTYNYGEVTGTKDITQQLKDNPKGGIITIIILNSELKNSSNNGSNNFGININEWEKFTYNVF